MRADGRQLEESPLGVDAEGLELQEMIQNQNNVSLPDPREEEEPRMEVSQIDESKLSQHIKEHLQQNEQPDLLNKLPQNYFMNQEDDDSDNMEEVIGTIQNMRNEMLNYANENHLDMGDIPDIANIIEPHKFIAKHYGSHIREGQVVDTLPDQSPKPPEFLFEKDIEDLAPDMSKQGPKQIHSEIDPVIEEDEDLENDGQNSKS